MNEKENKTEYQKPKTSKLAVLSPLVVALGFSISWYCGKVAIYVWLLSTLVGFILGIAALWQINYSKGRITGKVSATFGIVIATISLLLLPVASPIKPYNKYIALMRICENNLSGLGKAMLIYAHYNNGKYPTADKWCDILLEDKEEIKEKMFICPGASKLGNKERCHYVMNPNCEPNSPVDTVLLFETEGGWNLYGGPELLSTINHDEQGCNILFNDGHVEFFRKENLQDLKWK